jgi:hypothetical protein
MKGLKLDTIIGVGLLIITVLGFLISVIVQLPKKEQIDQVAQPLPTIPANMFSSDNELTKAVRALSKPNGVPVTVDPSTIGRTNVFENF